MESTIESIIDLQRYPLNQPESDEVQCLIRQCQSSLDKEGLFNLPGFLQADVIPVILAQAKPLIKDQSFFHHRRHNIYFLPEVPGLEAGHPVLKEFDTSNHTVCADQIPGSPLLTLYHWQPFISFLSAIMKKPTLYPMDDDLSCLNVMAYRHGEALNWHFDRSEYTTTLLLQAPDAGGEFQYRCGLRREDDPNYNGIADFLNSDFSSASSLPLEAGTLNVFRGKNTLHRVAPVIGQTQRIISILTYYETPGKRFSKEEQIGFYGRSNH